MRIAAAALAFFFVVTPLAAQNSGAIRTEGAVRQLQTQSQRESVSPQFRLGAAVADTAPELYPGESDDIGPQYLIEQKVKRTLVEAAVDAQYLYTSNVFLTEKGNVDTGLLISTVLAAVAPTPFEIAGGQLSLRAGYRHQRYNYGLDDTANQLNNVDFDAGTAFASGQFVFRENWSALLGIDYNRLLSHERDFQEFYTEVMPGWGLSRQITLNDHHAVSVGYFGACHFTHTEPDPATNINDRLDSIASLAWTWQLWPGIFVQPFYRFQQTHYWQDGDRDDVFHAWGATLLWLINDWASVRAFSSFETRESDDTEIQDYGKYDTGGGVSLVLRF